MMSGRIVILNGAPRSGKSSIAKAMQAGLDGAWINLGVDVAMAATPERLLPGIGLRPGGERPDLEPFVRQAYDALFQSIAAHAASGLDVVSDLGVHDHYSRPLGILAMAADTLARHGALLVGVHCPLATIMERRNADPRGGYYAAGDTVPEPVLRWQEAVHRPGIYDLELDTSQLSPEQCADAIGTLLASPPTPTALQRLAQG